MSIVLSSSAASSKVAIESARITWIVCFFSVRLKHEPRLSFDMAQVRVVAKKTHENSILTCLDKEDLKLVLMYY